MKSSNKISFFLFLMTLLLVITLGSCAKTELNDFDIAETIDQDKQMSAKENSFISNRSDDGKDDDFVTDDEDDDEEEEDDKK